MTYYRSAQSKARGFTLIELIVVFAIIGIFALVVTFRHDSVRDRVELEQFMSNLVLFVRTVQAESTVALEKVHGVRLDLTGAEPVILRYEGRPVQFGGSGAERYLETLAWPEEVLLTEGCGRSGSTEVWQCTSSFVVDVLFERAVTAPEVYINGDQYTAARIDVSERGSSQGSTIIINENGTVYVQ